MAVSLWQDQVQKRLAHNEHGAIGGSLFLHQRDGRTLQVMGM